MTPQDTAKERADLGFGDDDSFDLDQGAPDDALADLSAFQPKVKPAKPPAPKAAEAAGFRSREPKAPKPEPAPVRKQRRRRTGRNAQFNIKAKPETIEAFYKVADTNDWGLGETLEHAVALLEKKYL